MGKVTFYRGGGGRPTASASTLLPLDTGLEFPYFSENLGSGFSEIQGSLSPSAKTSYPHLLSPLGLSGFRFRSFGLRCLNLSAFSQTPTAATNCVVSLMISDAVEWLQKTGIRYRRWHLDERMPNLITQLSKAMFLTMH